MLNFYDGRTGEHQIDDCQVLKVENVNIEIATGCSVKKLKVFCIDSKTTEPYQHLSELAIDRYVYCDKKGKQAWSRDIQKLDSLFKNCGDINETANSYYPFTKVDESEYQCDFVGNPLFVSSAEKCTSGEIPKFCRAAISCVGTGNIVIEHPKIDENGSPIIKLDDVGNYKYQEVHCLEKDCINPLLCLRRSAKEIDLHYNASYYGNSEYNEMRSKNKIKVLEPSVKK
ncbi:MAG: hypothetical protein QE271_05990 [Bacteriovoracaceae bacterium]|nr:hypothetical protein [Bacteriovoracaceae bacterium]